MFSIRLIVLLVNAAIVFRLFATKGGSFTPASRRWVVWSQAIVTLPLMALVDLPDVELLLAFQLSFVSFWVADRAMGRRAWAAFAMIAWFLVVSYVPSATLHLEYLVILVNIPLLWRGSRGETLSPLTQGWVIGTQAMALGEAGDMLASRFVSEDLWRSCAIIAGAVIAGFTAKIALRGHRGAAAASTLFTLVTPITLIVVIVPLLFFYGR